MRTLIAIAFVILAASCRDNTPDNPDPTRDLPTAAPPAVLTISNLQAPESVLYDPEQDVYLVSNMNGGFLTQDNNGFISRINPENGATDLNWIAGGRNGTTLHAPKGMAIAGDTLYVSDVNAVRKFDRRTGAPRGEIAIPGATFINDLVSDGENIFLSDSGMLPGPGEGFVARGSDAIWKISSGGARKVAAGERLHQPNGLALVDGDLWVASFASNELYRLAGDAPGKTTRLPMGELDGVIALPDGSFIVSCWEAMAIYRGDRTGSFRPLLAGISAPADIGYDSKRRRLLVPRPTDNQATVHQL
jgi:sugar lactone lactonase YvrE